PSNSLTPQTSPLSLHDALPICSSASCARPGVGTEVSWVIRVVVELGPVGRVAGERLVRGHTRAAGVSRTLVAGVVGIADQVAPLDRKSTRLNSSHVKISYAVFC